jgi:hypothetical protein
MLWLVALALPLLSWRVMLHEQRLQALLAEEEVEEAQKGTSRAFFFFNNG